MASLLKLGDVDKRAGRQVGPAFFSRYHEDVMFELKFRGEKNGEWIGPRVLPGGEVRALQTSLRALGFYPNGDVDGIFGYRTVSSVRLFQEYVRSVERRQEIGVPDGIVGPRTRNHISRWEADRLLPFWQSDSSSGTTGEYRYWMEVLKLYKKESLRKPGNRVDELVSAFAGPTDTIKVANRQYDVKDIHLIGIRRREWLASNERKNDDLFILLVNGMAFAFPGSTDPNPSMTTRSDEPFIVRGQHTYRFGWHKLEDFSRVYRALRPLSAGVLVCRDFENDNALTDEDLLRGGLSSNETINIHWSGSGTKNWSAGCQVVAGARYVNAQSSLVDCREFAAASYGALSNMTRGAYNVFLDLMTVFAPSISTRGGSLIYYTVMHQSDLDRDVGSSRTLAAEALHTVSGLSVPQREKLRQNVSVASLAAALV